jgi:hypothetical protein
VYYRPSENIEAQQKTMDYLSQIRRTYLTGNSFLEIYGNFVHMSYAYDVIRAHATNAIESNPKVLRKLMKRLHEMVDVDEEEIVQIILNQIPNGEDVIRAVVRNFHHFLCIFKDLLYSKHDATYQKTKAKQKMKRFEEELIRVTWHPNRFVKWCLDEEEKREIFTFFN